MLCENNHVGNICIQKFTQLTITKNTVVVFHLCFNKYGLPEDRTQTATQVSQAVCAHTSNPSSHSHRNLSSGGARP